MVDIAVFLTCFNRKNKTLRCLEQLHSQKCSYTIHLSYYVCDDGSTDGTAGEIREKYPDVNIIRGSGNLFWARGMAAALDAAKGAKNDFYLMANDDVDFFDDAIEILLDSYYQKKDEMCSIVGSTKDAQTHQHTYGGLMWNGKAHPEIAVPVYPNADCPECNQTNWNCFLVPVKVYEEVGEIDRTYEHSKADFDYSNRICQKGLKIYVARDYIGTCSRNSTKNTWRDVDLPLRKRLILLHRPNGSPWRSRWHYCKSYYGGWAVYKFLLPYAHIVSSSIKRRISGRRGSKS